MNIDLIFKIAAVGIIVAILNQILILILFYYIVFLRHNGQYHRNHKILILIIY